jgi:hypothetical protein
MVFFGYRGQDGIAQYISSVIRPIKDSMKETAQLNLSIAIFDPPSRRNIEPRHGA